MTKVKLSKINQILFFVIAVLVLLYIGSGFFIPLFFAVFFSTLILPLNKVFEKWGMGKYLSAFLSTLILFVGVSGLIVLLFFQLEHFVDDLPQLQLQLLAFMQDLKMFIISRTGLTPTELEGFYQGLLEQSHFQERFSVFLEQLLFTFLHFLLVLIYVFLFLISRKKFVSFVQMYMPKEKHVETEEVIAKASRVAHHYLWGRIQVMSLLALMYIITFWIFDVPYAILLTVFGAIITIIPYLGPYISGVLPVIIVLLAGEDLNYVLMLAGVILVVQLIESYVLEPLIIGKEVELSPLMIILAIIIGGMLWGLAGMIIFVPIIAVSKILFDHIKNLKPLGFLIGNSNDNSHENN